MEPIDKRITIPFRKVTNPNEEGYLEYLVPADCTIEKLNILFYPGSQGSLHVKPCIIKKGGHAPEPLFEYVQGGFDYISGDDVYYKMEVTHGASQNDWIRVYYVNTDSVNPYTLICDVVVDFVGGKVSVR